MTKPTGHSCAASGCEEQILLSRMMCATHWRILPGNLRDSINTAYRRRNMTKLAQLAVRAVHIIDDAEQMEPLPGFKKVVNDGS